MPRHKTNKDKPSQPAKNNTKNPGGRPPIFETPEEMQTAVDTFFETRKKEEKPCTIMGLALALGMCRDTLHEYSKNGKFSDIVKNARNLIVDNVEDMLFSGKPAAGPIFWLKNNAGYVDKQEIAHTGADGKPLTVIVHRGSDLAQIAAPDPEEIQDAEVEDSETHGSG